MIAERYSALSEVEICAMFDAFNAAVVASITSIRLRPSRENRVAASIASSVERPSADGSASGRLQVTFNPLTLATLKNIIAYMTAGLTNGIMSPQTARKRMGLVEAVENANMKAARANKDNYTPVFEAKQGLLQEPENANDNPENTGGRPTEK